MVVAERRRYRERKTPTNPNPGLTLQPVQGAMTALTLLTYFLLQLLLLIFFFTVTNNLRIALPLHCIAYLHTLRHTPTLRPTDRSTNRPP